MKVSWGKHPREVSWWKFPEESILGKCLIESVLVKVSHWKHTGESFMVKVSTPDYVRRLLSANLKMEWHMKSYETWHKINPSWLSAIFSMFHLTVDIVKFCPEYRKNEFCCFCIDHFRAMYQGLSNWQCSDLPGFVLLSLIKNCICFRLGYNHSLATHTGQICWHRPIHSRFLQRSLIRPQTKH